MRNPMDSYRDEFGIAKSKVEEEYMNDLFIEALRYIYAPDSSKASKKTS